MTTIHFNTLYIATALMGVAGMLCYMLVMNEVTDHRFVELVALLGFVVKGLVDCAKTFAARRSDEDSED